MFRLSTKADYGLILLSTLRRGVPQGKPLSIATIAIKNQISPKFLSQIAQDLKKAGILTSKEGVSGGYTLAKKADDIKLLDVLKVLDGELVEGKCFEDDHECVCGAEGMWKEMREQIEATIGKKTVADLVVRQMQERSADEVAYDPMFSEVYLGVREHMVDGARTTIVIEFWNDRDQVEAVLRANKVINPGGLYRLYDPLEEGKIRRGLIIGGEE